MYPESSDPVGWRKLTVPETFSISFPADATYVLEDTLLTITLKTDPNTDVLVGKFDFSPAEGIELRSIALETAVRRFVEECISKVIRAPAKNTSYETNWRDGMWVCQAVVLVEGDRWWLVRAYAHPANRDYFLLHWNGPEKYLRQPVLSIFESFAPRFMS